MAEGGGAVHPGILVFNFHPQNFADTDRMHVEVMRLARRPGWSALGAHSFLDWLEARENVRLVRSAGGWQLNRAVAGLTLRYPCMRLSANAS